MHGLHLSGQTDDLDASIEPRGYRILARIPRLPEAVASASWASSAHSTS